MAHAVLTFEPHPREFFHPEQPSFRLTPFRMKVRQLEAMGVDHLFVLHFDEALSRKSAEAFVVEILSEGLEAAHVVVGYDFVFGHGRRGDAGLLRDLGSLHGIGVSEVEPLAGESGEVFSSTRVREHLRSGRPRDAAELLGRPWEIEGRVEHGAARGRGLGFPTANLPLADQMRPAHGIYAVKAGIDHGRGTVWRDGSAYIGRRPTFAGEDVGLEVYLFDFDGDLYGRHLRVALIDFLRPDQRFDDARSLARQIEDDNRRARAALAAYSGPPPGAAPPRPRRPAAAERRGVYETALSPWRRSGG